MANHIKEWSVFPYTAVVSESPFFESKMIHDLYNEGVDIVAPSRLYKLQRLCKSVHIGFELFLRMPK